MSRSSEAPPSGIAQLFLRYAASLAGLRRLPVVGALVGWASGKLLPRDALVWAQVQHDPAAGLWLHLNPRTGSLCFAGGREPEVCTDPSTSPDRGLGHVVSAAGTIRVRATFLDEFAGTRNAPDFLKCDVEGAEVEFFRGAQRLLAEKRPGILSEMHSEENRRILLTQFARHRYACKALDEHHVLALPQ